VAGVTKMMRCPACGQCITADMETTFACACGWSQDVEAETDFFAFMRKEADNLRLMIKELSARIDELEAAIAKR